VALIDGGSLRAGYGTLVTLDAARSSDPDGDRLRYAWRIVRGPRGTKATGRADRVRFTFRTAPARSLFPVRPTFGAGFMTQIMDSVTGRPTGYVTDTSIEYSPAGRGFVLGGGANEGSANLGRSITARFSILR